MAPPRQKKATLARTPRARLRDRQVLLIILGVNLVLCLLLFDPKLATGGDNATYIILAKSILKGSYRDLFLPGTPPHTQFPPVWPLLLAPLVALFGDNFIPLKFLALILGMGALGAFYLVLKRVTTKREWILPLALFALCPVFLRNTHDMFSEIPFIFFSLLSVWSLLRGTGYDASAGRHVSQVDSGAAARHKPLFIGLAGLLAALSFLTRTQGIALPVAMGVFLLLRKRWRELVVFAGVFVVVWLPWLLRDLSLPHAGGYLTQFLLKDEYNLGAGYVQFPDMINRILANLTGYLFRIFPAILVPFLENGPKAISGLVGVMLGAMILAGSTAESKRRRIGPIELYVMFSVGLVMLWPNVWAGDRFLFPILPFLLWYLIVGLRWLGAKIGSQRLALFASIVLFLFLGIADIRDASRNLTDLSGYLRGDRFAGYEEPWRSYFGATNWLRSNTDTSAVVVSRKPGFTYLYSGRKSFVYPMTDDQKKVLASIGEKGATHLFLETFFGSTARYLYPVVRDHPDRFEQVGSVGSENVRVLIFKVKG